MGGCNLGDSMLSSAQDVKFLLFIKPNRHVYNVRWIKQYSTLSSKQVQWCHLCHSEFSSLFGCITNANNSPLYSLLLFAAYFFSSVRLSDSFYFYFIYFFPPCFTLILCYLQCVDSQSQACQSQWYNRDGTTKVNEHQTCALHFFPPLLASDTSVNL